MITVLDKPKIVSSINNFEKQYGTTPKLLKISRFTHSTKPVSGPKITLIRIPCSLAGFADESLCTAILAKHTFIIPTLIRETRNHKRASHGGRLLLF